MNKIFAIIFLAIILIFTQNKVLSYASFSDNNLDTSIEINSSDKSHELYELEDEDINEVEDVEDNNSNRVISIIPGSTLPAVIKQKSTGNILPTTTPTQTTDTTVTLTPTQTTGINTEVSQDESTSASFDFIKELEKLLSSLKKIIFTTLS